MVFLFNKARIYSYLIAVTTVIVLFAVATKFDSDDLSIQASTTTNIVNKIENTINTVKNE